MADDSDRTNPMSSVTFLMPAELRLRARDAYRGSAVQEDDETWAAFLTKAVEREVVRREQSLNGGEPFPRSEERLRPGRGNRRFFRG